MRHFLCLITACVHVFSAEPDFTIITVPDTQNCTVDEFTSMGSWIKTNAAAMNVQAVISLGDNAFLAAAVHMSKTTNLWHQIANVVPSLVVIGNHDTEADGTRVSTGYNAFYGQFFFTNQPSWNGGFYSTNSDNFYFRKTFGGNPWIIFGIEIGPRDVILNWVSNTAAAYPNDKVLISTHAWTKESGWQDGTDPADTIYTPTVFLPGSQNANTSWRKSLRTIRNLFLIISGHYLDFDNVKIRRSVAIGDNGNHVMQSLANYQSSNVGGSWLRILTFRPSLNTCDATTIQTTTGNYNTNRPHQFSFELFKNSQPIGPKVFGVGDLSSIQ